MAFTIQEKPPELAPPKIEQPAAGPKLEVLVVPEKKEERAEREEVEVALTMPEPTPTVTPVAAAVAAASTKDELDVAIEKILEEDLSEIFRSLPDAKKLQFKQEGELAEKTIKDLVQSAKATLVTVMAALRKWLRALAGVNAFFLEQLVKIKADKIMELAESAQKTLV